jgi:hypothetical protein
MLGWHPSNVSGVGWTGATLNRETSGFGCLGIHPIPDQKVGCRVGWRTRVQRPEYKPLLGAGTQVSLEWVNQYKSCRFVLGSTSLSQAITKTTVKPRRTSAINQSPTHPPSYQTAHPAARYQPPPHLP